MSAHSNEEALNQLRKEIPLGRADEVMLFVVEYLAQYGDDVTQELIRLANERIEGD